MDKSQLNQRKFLENMANSRKGVSDIQPSESKEVFSKTSVNNIRQKMAEAAMEERNLIN